MAEIQHASTIVDMLVDIAATIRASEVTANTDFRGASRPYVMEKIHAVENELRVMKKQVKQNG